MLVVGAMTGERDAVGGQHLAMNEIVHGFADERIAVEFRAEIRIAMDQRAARRGDVVRAAAVR